MTEIEVEFTPKSTFSRMKIFLVAFVGIFVMMFLKQIGVSAPRFSFPTKVVDQKAKITPLMEKKPNHFHVNNIFQANQAYAAQDYDNAKAYEVVNLDNGNMILSKSQDQPLPIASLTKIMSAVVVLDLAKENQLFTVQPEATSVSPTRIGVVAGEKMSVSELLQAALMTSANDAIAVIRDGIDSEYGKGTFVYAMNKKAEFLGLTHTHFANPQGFDSSVNYSTTNDLTVLSQYALTNYPLIAQIVKQEYAFLPASSLHKQFDLYNWNGLLGVYPGAYGIKIGNTDNAGYTNIVASDRGNTHLLVVMLGAPGVVERDQWASELLDSGYQKTLNLAPVNVTKDQLLTKYHTWKYWN